MRYQPEDHGHLPDQRQVPNADPRAGSRRGLAPGQVPDRPQRSAMTGFVIGALVAMVTMLVGVSSWVEASLRPWVLGLGFAAAALIAIRATLRAEADQKAAEAQRRADPRARAEEAAQLAALRFSVQELVTHSRVGVMAVGKVVEGWAAVDRPVAITRAGQVVTRTRVSGIQYLAQKLVVARAGDNVALVLAEVDPAEVQSGDVIVDAAGQVPHPPPA